MFNLTITNFKTLETRKITVSRWDYIETNIRRVLQTNEQNMTMILNNNNIFVKSETEMIGGCVIKQFEYPKTEIMYGDIFYAELEENGTSIQSGIRPVLIVSNNMCNTHSTIISVVPFTSQEKTQALPTQMIISPKPYTGLNATSTLMCEQVISLSKENLKSRIGSLTLAEMEEVSKCIKVQLNLK